jgi:hypothetical protein
MPMIDEDIGRREEVRGEREVGSEGKRFLLME